MEISLLGPLSYTLVPLLYISTLGFTLIPCGID
jgi:hypothetical protein